MLIFGYNNEDEGYLFRGALNCSLSLSPVHTVNEVFLVFQFKNIADQKKKSSKTSEIKHNSFSLILLSK